MDFWKKLEEHRTLEKDLAWEGTFSDYLKIVKNSVEVCQVAHSRIYEMIKSAGIESVNGRNKYNFFPLRFLVLTILWKNWWKNIFIPQPEDLTLEKGFCC